MITTKGTKATNVQNDAVMKLVQKALVEEYDDEEVDSSAYLVLMRSAGKALANMTPADKLSLSFQPPWEELETQICESTTSAEATYSTNIAQLKQINVERPEPHTNNEDEQHELNMQRSTTIQRAEQVMQMCNETESALEVPLGKEQPDREFVYFFTGG